MIKISSNEELEIAIEEMSSKSNICKLYIKTQNVRETVPLSYDKETTLHHHVVCDVCHIGIKGFRFKCMQCENYDLCCNCMLLGHHSEHYLVRIVHRVDWKSREGRRLYHHLHKWTKHCKDDERKLNKSNKRRGCPYNQTGKRDAYDAFFLNPLMEFLDTLRVASSDENQEQKRSEEQQKQRDPSAEAATEATEEDPQEATRHGLSQIMKIVEDNISNITQFLDPLGINVTVINDKDSAKDKAGGTQKTENHASTSGDSAKKFPGEGRKLNGDETANTADEKAAPSMSDASSLQKAPSTSAEQAAEAEEWTIVHSQDESSKTSRASSTSSLNEVAPKQVRFA